MNKAERVAVTRRNVEKYAGVRKFRFGEAESDDLVGVTTGLAWTEVGGELLTIEAVTVPGKGRVTATGKLGDVMKELVQAAESFVKSRSYGFGHHAARCSRRRTSTSTCRRVRRPRTARRPVSRW